jgi:hypothetical protein
MLSDIRPGDVFVVRSRGYWYSDAIAWFMGPDRNGDKWSHTGIVRDVASDIGLITLETTDFEVTYCPLNKYVSNPEKYHLKVMRPKEFTGDINTALKETDAQLNESMYGYLQLLSFAVKRLLGRIGIKIPNMIRQGQVCTAVTLTYLSKCGPDYFRKLDVEEHDTTEFANMAIDLEFEVIWESGRDDGSS